MRINSKDYIAGQSILLIRGFLKYVQLRDWWTIEVMIDKLRVSDTVARKIIKVLIAENYIEEAKPFGLEQTWSNTIKGNSLAMATAAAPIHRETADKLIVKFIERVKAVNQEDKYAYKVNKVIIFGSYLSNKDRLNDIDIAIELAPKEKNTKKQGQKNQARIASAREERHLFRNLVDEVCWPIIEVQLFLKSHSKSISLHNTSDLVLKTANQRIIFEEN